MPRLRRLPVMLPEPLAARLAARAVASGESQSTIMRMALDSDLRMIKRAEASDRDCLPAAPDAAAAAEERAH